MKQQQQQKAKETTQFSLAFSEGNGEENAVGGERLLLQGGVQSVQGRRVVRDARFAGGRNTESEVLQLPRRIRQRVSSLRVWGLGKASGVWGTLQNPLQTGSGQRLSFTR